MLWEGTNGGHSELLTDIACCFRASAEIRWAFAPAHLQALEYDEFGWFREIEFREDISKIPFCVILYHCFDEVAWKQDMFYDCDKEERFEGKQVKNLNNIKKEYEPEFG